jgi:hypothetical protein
VKNIIGNKYSKIDDYFNNSFIEIIHKNNEPKLIENITKNDRYPIKNVWF